MRDRATYLESLHPEGRGRVRKALAHPATGREDELVCRVLRPDGGWLTRRPASLSL